MNEYAICSDDNASMGIHISFTYDNTYVYDGDYVENKEELKTNNFMNNYEHLGGSVVNSSHYWVTISSISSKILKSNYTISPQFLSMTTMTTKVEINGMFQIYVT